MELSTYRNQLRAAKRRMFMYLRMNAIVHNQSSVKDNKAVRLFASHCGVEIPEKASLDQWLVDRYNSKFSPLFENALEVRARRPKIKKNYYNYIKSPAWQKKRKEVFDFYGKKCFKCQATKEIEVHHLTYKNLGNEPIEDLIPLCNKCHQRLHKSALLIQT